MKKGCRIFIFVLLNLAYFVYLSCLTAAQEISIGSYTYPAIILVPIISIIVSSIIIIFILVKVIKTRRGVFGGKEGGIASGIATLFSRKKTKEEKRQENIYLKEIKKFKRNLPRLPIDEAFNQLSDVTKNFFKELLGLKYEFTYDELTKELRRRRMKEEFLDSVEKLSHLRYSGKKIAREELENFADTIEGIIRKETRKKEEKELGVSKALTKEKKGVFTRLAILKREETERARKKRILDLMKEEEEALKKDMDIAKEIYHRILSSYYKLPVNERKEIYGKLMDFYKEVNRMIFSSFYGKRSRKELEYFSKRLAKLKKEAEEVEKVVQEKPTEKVKEAIERLKLPELKLKPVKEVEKKKHKKELSKEREREKIELKKLEEVEKRAKERIKRISDTVIKERMAAPISPPSKKEEIRISKEIKPKPIIKPAIVHPKEKQVVAHVKHIVEPVKTMPAKPMPKIHEAKREERLVKEVKTPKKHIEPVKKKIEIPIKKEPEKESPKEEVKAKDKKIGMLEREEEAIRERLERLRRYVG